MDLLSFVIGLVVGLGIGAVSIYLYLRIYMKKMLSNLGDINKMLEMLKGFNK